jgi:hypothetical protein
MSGALSVVPVRPNPPYQSTALTHRLVSFPDPTPESYWNTQRRTRYVHFLFSSTSSNMDGWLLSHNTRHYLHNQLLGNFPNFQSNSLSPFILHTSSSIMNEFILDMADILVRYPCKYPSEYNTITHLYRRHLACPIISHLQPSQDIILTSFLFFVNRPL